MTPPYIIAEAGVNHDGDLDKALALVDAASAAGADAVKFQTFAADRLVSIDAEKAAYQKRTTGADESQYAMLKRLELSEGDHRVIANRCAERGIEFLSTPFDEESLRFLVDDMRIGRIKIPSGELTNGPLLLAAARTGLPLVVSTGMATMEEIGEALGVIAYGVLGGDDPTTAAFAECFASEAGKSTLRAKVTILHCTTEYPAPDDETNLAAVDTLRNAFGLPTGFSDHTVGIAAAIAATARGAVVIEKHFTLDKSLPGPDHAASLEPDELTAMVTACRRVAAMIGDGAKTPTRSESKNSPVARKSLVTTRPMKAGEIFGPDDITPRRPGGGVSPMRYWEWVGAKATRDYDKGEPL
jgi:N-acetylneuraminate synthase